MNIVEWLRTPRQLSVPVVNVPISKLPCPANDTHMPTIIEGDSLSVMRNMADESFDAVITDPPYGMNYKSATKSAVANDERPYIWWLLDAYRVVKQGGCLISFCNTRTAETWRVAIECAGFKVTSQGVWDRGIHGMGDCKKAMAPRHDVIWMATKGKFKFPGKRLTSVLRHQREPSASTLHPTRKPVGLMREIIESVVPACGTLLDPFAGSGSTGEAAMQSGRRATLIEMVPDYVAEIRQRTAA